MEEKENSTRKDEKRERERKKKIEKCSVCIGKMRERERERERDVIPTRSIAIKRDKRTLEKKRLRPRILWLHGPRTQFLLSGFNCLALCGLGCFIER